MPPQGDDCSHGKRIARHTHEDRPLKIAYLSDQSPEDRFTYSGGNQRICNALRDHVGEASAHGLPSLCLRVGGGPVRDGINGHALPPGATVADFAACIARYVDDLDTYAKLRRSSRQEYMTRLNWASWGETVRAQLLATRASASGAAQHHAEGPHHDPQVGQE